MRVAVEIPRLAALEALSLRGVGGVFLLSGAGWVPAGRPGRVVPGRDGSDGSGVQQSGVRRT